MIDHLVGYNLCCLAYYAFVCVTAQKVWKSGACASGLFGYFITAILVGAFSQVVGSAFIFNVD